MTPRRARRQTDGNTAPSSSESPSSGASRPVDGPWEPVEPARLMANAIHGRGGRRRRRRPRQRGRHPRLRRPGRRGATTPSRPRSATWSARPVRPHRGLPRASPCHRAATPPATCSTSVATRIVDGDSRLALLAGAEALYSRRRAGREGVDLVAAGWTPFAGHRDFLKGQRPLRQPARGPPRPHRADPRATPCSRTRCGPRRTARIDEHQRFLGVLMAAHAAVAATNPYAWFPDGLHARGDHHRHARTTGRCAFPTPSA